MKPLFDYVVIELATDEEENSSGIVLPDSVSKENVNKGTVVAIGSGKVLESGAIHPLSVKVGDSVMFRPFAGEEIKIKGQSYITMRETDIMLILE